MKEVGLNEFLGHVFGAKSSGCMATFTLRYHVNKNADKYGAVVVHAISRNFYVDDLIKSLRDVATAKAFRKDSTAALKEGGFDLCKWRSTHPEALEDGNPDAPSRLGCLEAENGAGIDKILGMCYDFSKDEFFFQIDLVKFLMEVLNKRGPCK